MTAATASFVHAFACKEGNDVKSLYTARATATKGGRGTGTAATDDGKVSVKFSTPREMGGDGGPGTNPDQLFAVAYSGCFLGAMKLAGKRRGETVPDAATMTAHVSFLDREDGVGFAIAVTLEGHVPGMPDTKVLELMTAAHDICPYSWAIRHTVDVQFKAV